MESICKKLGDISFEGLNPKGLLYMHKTKMGDISLPKEFEAYSEKVRDMISMVANKSSVCYVTIDSKIVRNEIQRRGGIHVDFNWYEEIISHGSPSGPMHGPAPSHRPGPAHLISGHDGPPHFATIDPKGGMLLSSNEIGCQFWRGDYLGDIGKGGDCSNINVNRLETGFMKPGEVYFVNALGIHEGIPIIGEKHRTLIRINFNPEFEPIFKEAI
jgi:hypothetical protein